MKKIFFATAVFTLLLGACKSHNHTREEHDHSSEVIDAAGERTLDTDHDDEIIFSALQAKAAGLEIITAESGTFNRIIKTSGEVRPAPGDEITIVAVTNGTVSVGKNPLTAGSAVKAGETIANISSAKIADGDPALKSKAAFEAAEQAYKRAETLVGEKIISQKDFEQARLNYETARISYDAVKANHTASGVAVTSPVEGFIAARMVGEGEYVTAGTPIAKILSNRRLQLVADVPVKYYRELPTIATANFKMPDDDRLYKLSELGGRVLSYGRVADNGSPYIPFVFSFDNTAQILPGSFAEVYLYGTPVSDVISVPLSALIEEQGVYSVMIQLDEEGYKKQAVSIGEDNGESVVILSGVEAGDRVVTRGAVRLKLAASSSTPQGHTH